MKKLFNLAEMLPKHIVEGDELTEAQKRVLYVLVNMTGLEEYKKKGTFFASNEKLMEDCSVSKQTLITAINKLQSLGYIEDRKPGFRSKDGKFPKGVASTYKINLDKIFKNDNEDEKKVLEERILLLEERIKMLEEKLNLLNQGSNPN